MFLIFTYIHTATLNRSRGDFQLEKKMLTNPALPEPAPKARTGERVVTKSPVRAECSEVSVRQRRVVAG